MTNLILLNREILTEDELTECVIVPLNSVAMRDVLKNGLNYIKLEEFIDYEFCKDNKEKIWRVFQDLLDKADEIVSQIYENPKIRSYGPFNLFAKGIRQTLETMVHNWIIINKIILKIRPSEIKLLSRKVNYDSSELSIARYSDTLYKIIIESIAKKCDIGFTFQSIEARRGEYLKSGRNIIFQTIINLVKKLNLYHNLKIGIRESRVNKIKEIALFVQHDWGIYYYSQFFTRVINELRIEDSVIENEPNDKYQEIGCAEILDQLRNEIYCLNNLYGFDVKLLVEATLRGYIEKVPLVISNALRSEDYLQKLAPRFVFWTNLHENMLPFQMALRWNNKITKIVKDHGDAMFDATFWRNTELKPADLYFTEFEEFASYLKINAEQANIKVRCEYDGLRLNKCYRRTKIKNKLVYVPGFFDPCLSFDILMIPQPLYYRIQVSILQLLNEQKDIDDVVYKCLPLGPYNYHYPMPEYITNHFDNIRISYEPLKNELSDAKLCLLDSPSSSMWEAINMNVPCQTLIWNKIHLRPTGADYYDKFITYYDSDLDVSEKLQSIMRTKRFHILDAKEKKHMRRSPEDIRSILINSMSW
jgi:hypothetical protein